MKTEARANRVRSDPEEIFRETLSRLRNGSRELFGASTVQLEPLGYREGAYSNVLRIRIHGGAQPCIAYVKCYKTGSTSDIVAAEFETLQSAQKALAGNPEVSVARPIACFPDELSLITEEAPGVTIRQLLNRPVIWRLSPKNVQSLVAAFERMALWVKAFQHTGSAARARFSIAEMRQYVDVRLKVLVRVGLFTAREQSALLATFDNYSRRVNESDLAEVPVHGDFCPDNVLAHETGITVIDVGPAMRDSIYYDLAHMFCHVEKLAIRPWMGARVVRSAQSAMLQSFDAELDVERPLFQMELMRNIVSLLVPQDVPRASAVHRAYSSLLQRSYYSRMSNWIRDARRE